MSKKKAAVEVVPEPAPVIESKEPVILKGTFIFPDSSKYEGEYIAVENKKLRHGQGSYERHSERYEGMWKNDTMHGEGVYVFVSGSVYRGNFDTNCFDGEGTYTFPDGGSYKGHWKSNRMHGQGTYEDKTGAKFAGEFVNGYFFSGETYIDLRSASQIKS